MGFELVGQKWDLDSFPQYLKMVNLDWVKGVTFHHTGTPSLDQRPNGFTPQHMRNLRHFYKNELGWSAGPHLFVDEYRIWGMSSLEKPGIHAVSFNQTHIGIEVLGNYDEGRDDLTPGGRGLECFDLAIGAAVDILEAADLPETAFNFHRNDPKTKKSCPGSQVKRDWVQERISELLAGRFKWGPAEVFIGPEADQSDRVGKTQQEAVHEALEAIKWQLKKLEDILK